MDQEKFNQVSKKIEDAIIALMTTEKDITKNCVGVLKSLHTNGLSPLLVTRMLNLADGHIFSSKESQNLYTVALNDLLSFLRE